MESISTDKMKQLVLLYEVYIIILALVYNLYKSVIVRDSEKTMTSRQL